MTMSNRVSILQSAINNSTILYDEYHSYREKIQTLADQEKITHREKSFLIQCLSIRYENCANLGKIEQKRTVTDLARYFIEASHGKLMDDYQKILEIYASYDMESIVEALKIVKKTAEELYGENGEQIKNSLIKAALHYKRDLKERDPLYVNLYLQALDGLKDGALIDVAEYKLMRGLIE